MPKTRRPKPLYQRGGFRLDRRPDRDNLVITWNDPAIGRERSVSAGTADVEQGKAALDTKYLEITQGRAVCHACGRPFDSERSWLVTEAIEIYLHNAREKDSFDAIQPRLAHVSGFIATLPSAAVHCRDIDEAWIERFRAWAKAQPMVSTAGRVLDRQRAPSTIENSVIQLAAAIRHVGEKPAFKPIPTKEINRTPHYRADIKTLAAMFRFCVDPAGRTVRSDKERARRIRERAGLLAFLRASVVTLARPDAAHDISTDPKRRQWNSEHRVLNLNPDGRHQTRKRRATIKVARQAAYLFDDCAGNFVKVASVKSAFESMAAEIKLPMAGESGMKLIRRSMAHLIRGRLRAMGKSEDELEIFLGHRNIDSVSELYAPFDPNYLATVTGIIEGIVDEIEAMAPGAFYRDDTAQGGNVSSIGRAKSA